MYLVGVQFERNLNSFLFGTVEWQTVKNIVALWLTVYAELHLNESLDFLNNVLLTGKAHLNTKMATMVLASKLQKLPLKNSHKYKQRCFVHKMSAITNQTLFFGCFVTELISVSYT